MADNIIKQIKTPDNQVYNIHAFSADTAANADKLGGKSLTDIEGMINGVIDTYVIPSDTETSKKPGYSDIVNATTPQVNNVTASVLNGLTGRDSAAEYKLGDVILMGATSDGTNNFDRWVSNVRGTGAFAIKP